MTFTAPTARNASYAAIAAAAAVSAFVVLRAIGKSLDNALDDLDSFRGTSYAGDIPEHASLDGYAEELQVS